MQHNDTVQPQSSSIKSQHKRRWFIIILTAVFILITTAWIARERIAIYVASPYLAPYQLKITCLNWSPTWHSIHADQLNPFNKLGIKVNKVCLTHPLGNFTVNHLAIDNIKKPNNIFIEKIQASSNKPLGEQLLHIQNSKTASNKAPFTHIKLLDDIQQFVDIPLLPNNFYIKQLLLNAPNLTTPIQISAAQRKQALSLQINHQQQALTIEALYNLQSASIQAKVDLAPLIDTLKNQQMPLPQMLIQGNLQGSIATQITFAQQQLNADYQADNIQANINQIAINLPSTTTGTVTLTKEQIRLKNGAKPMVIKLNQGINEIINEKIDNTINNLSKKHQKIAKQWQAANLIDTITVTLPSNSTARLTQNYVALSKVSINTNKQILNTDIRKINYHLNKQLLTLDLVANSTISPPLTKTKQATFTEHPIKSSLSTQITMQVTAKNNNIHLNNSQLAITLNQLKHQQLSAEQLHFTTEGTLKWQDNTLNANASSKLQLSQIKHPKLAPINSLILSSQNKLTGPLDSLQHQLNTQTWLNNQTIMTIELTGGLSKPQLSIKGTDISLFPLVALNRSTIELPKLVSGKLDFALKTQLNNLQQPLNNAISGQFTLKDLSAEHQNTWIEALNYQQHFTINNGQLITQNSQPLTINKIEAGVVLTDIKALINYQLDIQAKDIQPTFSLNMENVSTQAFGGKVSFERFNFPDKQKLNLTLDAVDLEQIVALQKQQGIKVTGLISGVLPTTITEKQNKSKNKNKNKWQITIDNGELHNITDGVIQIKDNPAVQRLKSSRDDLRLAFDALQNLHYHQLSSQVTMSDDGQMYLQTVIKGVNPDLDNEVNFNLNLDYDLLGLLQSALISKKVEQQVNDKVKNQQDSQ